MGELFTGGDRYVRRGTWDLNVDKCVWFGSAFAIPKNASAPCLCNVGTASQTLPQHCTDTGRACDVPLKGWGSPVYHRLSLWCIVMTRESMEKPVRTGLRHKICVSAPPQPSPQSSCLASHTHTEASGPARREHHAAIVGQDAGYCRGTFLQCQTTRGNSLFFEH